MEGLDEVCQRKLCVIGDGQYYVVCSLSGKSVGHLENKAWENGKTNNANVLKGMKM